MDDTRDGDPARLDGNVAAGLLAELFSCEVSTAMFVCAGCGARGAVGTLLAYGLDMGVILRCAVCDTAVLRIGAPDQRRWIDMRGAVSLCVELPV
jgi:hypothetical protein